jgi:hypothetical protein
MKPERKRTSNVWLVVISTAVVMPSNKLSICITQSQSFRFFSGSCRAGILSPESLGTVLLDSSLTRSALIVANRTRHRKDGLGRR